MLRKATFGCKLEKILIKTRPGCACIIPFQVASGLALQTTGKHGTKVVVCEEDGDEEIEEDNNEEGVGQEGMVLQETTTSLSIEIVTLLPWTSEQNAEVEGDGPEEPELTAGVQEIGTVVDDQRPLNTFSRSLDDTWQEDVWVDFNSREESLEAANMFSLSP